LVGPIDRRRRIIWRTVFDPLTIAIKVHQLIRPVDLSCRPWRDQDLLPRPPILRIDDEIMDAPIGVLHKEILDVTDLAVAGMDVVSRDSFDAPKMRVVVVSLSVGDTLFAPPGSRVR